MKKLVLVIFAILAVAAGLAYYYLSSVKRNSQNIIKVGILHSLTGYTAINEIPIADATQFAIDEINQRGGVLGKKLVAVMADGKSDNPTFASEAERLLTQEKVSVIFGCWASPGRKAVDPILQKYDGLLFYPRQYEGIESSPNIVYTGPVPNQQVVPGTIWSLENLGTRVFLIGSDYVFPRVSNEIIKHVLAARPGSQIAGEEYLPTGVHEEEVKNLIQKLIASKPTVILNTLDAVTSKIFFHELRLAGITPEKIPTMSFSLSRIELDTMKPEDTLYDYVCWNYFQLTEDKVNIDFVARFHKKYGEDHHINNAMEAAYFGVHLWAQAVEEARSTALEDVRNALKNQAYHAPEGIVHIDSENQHTWKFIRIGKIRLNTFHLLWESHKAVRPLPYLTMFKSKEEWDEFINNLYKQWGNQWENRIK